MTEKSIYDLALHEFLDNNFHRMTRVPGGWLYDRTEDRWNESTQCWDVVAITSVFVPYHPEFLPECKHDKYKLCNNCVKE